MLGSVHCDHNNYLPCDWVLGLSLLADPEQLDPAVCAKQETEQQCMVKHAKRQASPLVGKPCMFADS